MNHAGTLHRDHFGVAAELMVDSPGRINLIGEHTDYCGLPVLPMAIGRSIQVAASEKPEPGIVAVSSLDGAEIRSEPQPAQPGWAPYVLAVADRLQPGDRGARLALDSDLPSTGGLSSSSALSVGCAFALNELWGLGNDPADLVNAAVQAERSVAVAGGAMDQTVISYARPGHALRIDFDPPAHRHVPIPEGFTFVAGYSGTMAPKGGSAAASYNSFVLASRAAAVMLGDDRGLSGGNEPRLSTVRDATPDELAKLPTISVADAAAVTHAGDLGLEPGRMLDLRVSAEHVLSEAWRVDAAEAALTAGERATMGHFMNESHASLVRYGASTPALDLVVAEARAAGASGARLTGAGFGGWAIALAPPATADAVEQAMAAAGGGPTFAASAEGGALWSLSTR